MLICHIVLHSQLLPICSGEAGTWYSLATKLIQDIVRLITMVTEGGEGRGREGGMRKGGMG